MKIKELQKTVNIAWSPQKQNTIFLAAGTAAQQIDSCGNSTLEIYSTNFSDPSYDLDMKVSLPSQFRFQKLIWSPTGFGTIYQNGLIVGGCEGGHIMIYDPANMLANNDGLIARQDKHTGVVSGLDFNPFQNNLLASCASESEIFIWDLNNTTTHMNPGSKTQPLEDVKNVAWNRQVQHILASVFSTRCVIWDLRKSEQIIKLSDTQSRVRWHTIQWHPEAATQVWLGSENDQEPVLQLWDLRYATTPTKSVQIHQRGVLGMSWCLHDVNLMVSCGKDNRIYCWNPNSQKAEGEILSEVATTSYWYSDVQCCPRNPALIASSSLEGNVSIYSLFGGSQQQVQTSNKIADSFPGMENFAQAPLSQQVTRIVYQDLKLAPKWIKRPCGVMFGFGGKLTAFNNKIKTIYLYQVITEPKLVERAKDLEKSLRQTNFIEYCRQKVDEMNDQTGRFLWYFIKANFEHDPKEEMLSLLGYNKENGNNKFSKYLFMDDWNQTKQPDMEKITNCIAQQNHSSSVTFNDVSPIKSENGIESPKAFQFKIPLGDNSDSLITEAILTRQVESAVHLCLKTNRIAEAFILASTLGFEFLAKTHIQYLKNQKHDSLSPLIKALITRDWVNFVKCCSLDTWKQALVAVLRYSESKSSHICEKLGDRLLSECPDSIENNRNAIICFICAGSTDKLVLAWNQLKALENDNSLYKLNTNELQELAEIIILINKALQMKGAAIDLSDEIQKIIMEYSTLLVAQGAFTSALAYITEMKTSSMGFILSDLYERIMNIIHPESRTVRGHQQANKTPLLYSQHSTFVNSDISTLNSSNTLPKNYQISSNLNYSILNNTVSQPLRSSNEIIPSFLSPKPASNEICSQPPRPPSSGSSLDGAAPRIGSANLHSRSKYVLDPSVTPSGIYSNFYNASTITNTANTIMSNCFKANSFINNNNIMNVAAPYEIQETITNTSFTNIACKMGDPSIEDRTTVCTTKPAVNTTHIKNMQQNLPSQPGWNDPPVLKTTRQIKSIDAGLLKAPITHPLFTVDPNYNQNDNTVAKQLYQDQNISYRGIMNIEPPNSSIFNAVQQQPLMNYQNIGLVTENNNNQINPQQQWQNKMPQMSIGVCNEYQYQHQDNQSLSSISRESENNNIIKGKLPLAEEYHYMRTVLEELKNQCLDKTNDARTKRKFVDVSKRLENLYDCLRQNKLTTATVQALNQIVQYLQVADYGNALQTHIQIAFGSDFSQCAGFMPGLKVLIQSANELKVYLP